jgi:alpha-mannosidase
MFVNFSQCRTLHLQAKQFRTNHLMWTMGDDFSYEYAHTWFKQMDKLVHYVNKV